MIFDDIEVVDWFALGLLWPATSAMPAAPLDEQLSMAEPCDTFSAKAFALGVLWPATSPPPVTSSTPEEGVSGARQTRTLCPSGNCLLTRCQPFSRSQVVQ